MDFPQATNTIVYNRIMVGLKLGYYRGIDLLIDGL